MKIKNEYPDDVFIYIDPDAQYLAQRLVFDLETDCIFKSTKHPFEVEETISEITDFLILHLGKRVLVETAERIARVMCVETEEKKMILIAFVNPKDELSPYETQPWAISVTPRRDSAEKYISIFLEFCLYG